MRSFEDDNLETCRVCGYDLDGDEPEYSTEKNTVHRECADRFLTDDQLDFYCEHGFDETDPVQCWNNKWDSYKQRYTDKQLINNQ